MACDADSGETVWEFPLSTSSPEASWFAESRAAPTPAADESGIFAFFEGGDLVALTHRGELRWHRSLSRDYGAFESVHGVGASLAQTEDGILVLVDHNGPSYLLSVDKATGQNLWKTDRSSRISWTTPIVAKLQDREQVIVSSNGSVDGYDLATGNRLWSLEEISGNTIASPVAVGNRLFIGAKGEKSSFCLEFPEDAAVGEYQLLWQNDSENCNYASPLAYQNNLYTVDRKGVIHCLDQNTGESRFAEKISDVCWASPLAIEDHIYFFAKNGFTTVIKTGPKFEEVAVNALWDANQPPSPESYIQNPPENSISSPTFVDRLTGADKNKDGLIAKNELPESMQRSFGRIDTSGNGFIDPEEIEAVEERVTNNANVSSVYDDPILYGFAVSNRTIYARTGTRLYCIRADNI